MHSICRYIDDELMDMEHKIQQGGKPSMGEIEYADKLAHLKKSILTNKAMEESGYSGTYRRPYEYRDHHTDDYDTYSMKRDSMGRYSRDGFMDKLMDLRNSAPDEKHRMAVDKMMSELNR